MIGANYADNLAIFTNTPAQEESQLQSQEKAVRGIGFYINANKPDHKKQSHLNFQRQAFKISQPVHIPRQKHFICGPVLVIEPSVVGLLVTALVVAVVSMTTTLAFDCLICQVLPCPRCVWKIHEVGVDTIQPYFLLTVS